MINQLFRYKPDRDLTIKIINIIGFENLYNNKKIFKSDLIKKNIVVNFNNIIEEVKKNYITCKSFYCNNLNEKKCITIARQHLKTIGHDIISETVYIDNRRFITYRIVQQKVKKNIQNKLEYTISFS